MKEGPRVGSSLLTPNMSVLNQVDQGVGTPLETHGRVVIEPGARSVSEGG